ncbi:MAG: methylated-DNA--[protein]-cysteine S-methyltransferase [Fusicatenibacter sp.]|nr:methylated-DNA--[protein]-cysteine S-methyltransferase [Fusicatenibacter sp.]
MLFQTAYRSPFGLVTMISDGTSLTGLYLEGQKFFCSSIREEMIYKNNLPVFDAAKDWLDRYFSGERPEISYLMLAPSGSEFRCLIWKLLCDIPYGQVTTYGTLAKKAALLLEKPHMSAQAVGGAVGHNPISIIIPCHRVIGSDGSLIGYAGGLELKARLLQLEGVELSGSYVHHP